MNKKIALVSMTLITLGVAGIAVMSSYGSVTGYATVEQALELDIMGSSVDQNYTLKAKQGETVYSPQIKIENAADTSFDVNITAEILPESVGNENDVSLKLVNEFKNETLTNPVTIPAEDFRIYLEHKFDQAAEVGNYSFRITVDPI